MMLPRAEPSTTLPSGSDAHSGETMPSRRHFMAGSAAAFCVSVIPRASAQGSPARITIISDAFGKASPLKRTWGYSALVEYGGRRILFDTGAKGADFAHNVAQLG